MRGKLLQVQWSFIVGKGHLQPLLRGQAKSAQEPRELFPLPRPSMESPHPAPFSPALPWEDETGCWQKQAHRPGLPVKNLLYSGNAGATHAPAFTFCEGNWEDSKKIGNICEQMMRKEQTK